MKRIDNYTFSSSLTRFEDISKISFVNEVYIVRFDRFEILKFFPRHFAILLSFSRIFSKRRGKRINDYTRLLLFLFDALQSKVLFINEVYIDRFEILKLLPRHFATLLFFPSTFSKRRERLNDYTRSFISLPL